MKSKNKKYKSKIKVFLGYGTYNISFKMREMIYEFMTLGKFNFGNGGTRSQFIDDMNDPNTNFILFSKCII